MRKLTDLLYFNSMKRVNPLSIRCNLLIEIHLSVSFLLSWVSQRLTTIIANGFQRFRMQEKFFCFECGMYFPEVEMRNTVGGWFGVCRLCNVVCKHPTEFRSKF